MYTAAAPPVLINAAGFRARSVRASDATQEIADWFADPQRVAVAMEAVKEMAG